MGSLNRTSNMSRRGRIWVILLLASVLVAALASVIASNRYSILATGTFHGVVDPGSGWVRVIQLRAGLRLELIGVHLEHPMPVDVRLIAASDAFDSVTAEAAAFRSVGVLPAGTISAEYAVDPALDLAKFRAVTLWSVARRLNLVTAPLQLNE